MVSRGPLQVSHRKEIATHHTHKLRFDSRGGASLVPIDSSRGDDSSTSDEFVHADH